MQFKSFNTYSGWFFNISLYLNFLNVCFLNIIQGRNTIGFVFFSTFSLIREMDIVLHGCKTRHINFCDYVLQLS